MEFIRLFPAQKKTLLRLLGYKVNADDIVVSEDNKPIICPYTGEPVRFNDASVMPGSTVIFNTTPLSLVEYFSEHVRRRGEVCVGDRN